MRPPAGRRWCQRRSSLFEQGHEAVAVQAEVCVLGAKQGIFGLQTVGLSSVERCLAGCLTRWAWFAEDTDELGRLDDGCAFVVGIGIKQAQP